MKQHTQIKQEDPLVCLLVEKKSQWQCYHDANAILIRSIKNRIGNELTSTLEDVFECLEERGFKPKFRMMDNEAAMNTIKMIKRQKINL